MSVFSRAIYETARLVGLPVLSRRLARGAVVLCYHNVVPPEYPAALAGGAARDPSIHMGLGQFQRQLTWLADTFDIVSLHELTSRVSTGKDVGGLACLTFDDGYLGFFKWALPILRTLQLPSAVFLVAEAHAAGTPYWWDYPVLLSRATAERRIQWLTLGRGDGATIRQMEQVDQPPDLPADLLPAPFDRILAAIGPDLTIGGHSRSHVCLPSVSDEDLHLELEGCRRQLAERLGQPPQYLAYPYGAWDARVRNAARVAGYHACLTLNSGRTMASGRSDLWALPRVNIPGGLPDAAFEAWVSGLLPRNR